MHTICKGCATQTSRRNAAQCPECNAVSYPAGLHAIRDWSSCAPSHSVSFPLQAIQQSSRPGNIAGTCGAYEPFGHVRKLLRDEEQDRRQKEELAQQLIREEEAAKKAAEKKKKKKKKKGQVPYGRRTCSAAV